MTRLDSSRRNHEGFEDIHIDDEESALSRPCGGTGCALCPSRSYELELNKRGIGSGVPLYFMFMKSVTLISFLSMIFTIPMLYINTETDFESINHGLLFLSWTSLSQMRNSSAFQIEVLEDNGISLPSSAEIPAIYSIFDVLSVLVYILGIFVVFASMWRLSKFTNEHSLGSEAYTLKVSGLERMTVCGKRPFGASGCGNCNMCASPHFTPSSLADHFESLAVRFTKNYRVARLGADPNGPREVHFAGEDVEALQKLKKLSAEISKVHRLQNRLRNAEKKLGIFTADGSAGSVWTKRPIRLLGLLAAYGHEVHSFLPRGALKSIRTAFSGNSAAESAGADTILLPFPPSSPNVDADYEFAHPGGSSKPAKSDGGRFGDMKERVAVSIPVGRTLSNSSGSRMEGDVHRHTRNPLLEEQRSSKSAVVDSNDENISKEKSDLLSTDLAGFLGSAVRADSHSSRSDTTQPSSTRSSYLSRSSRTDTNDDDEGDGTITDSEYTSGSSYSYSVSVTESESESDHDRNRHNTDKRHHRQDHRDPHHGHHHRHHRHYRGDHEDDSLSDESRRMNDYTDDECAGSGSDGSSQSPYSHSERYPRTKNHSKSKSSAGARLDKRRSTDIPSESTRQVKNKPLHHPEVRNFEEGAKYPHENVKNGEVVEQHFGLNAKRLKNQPELITPVTTVESTSPAPQPAISSPPAQPDTTGGAWAWISSLFGSAPQKPSTSSLPVPKSALGEKSSSFRLADLNPFASPAMTASAAEVTSEHKADAGTGAEDAEARLQRQEELQGRKERQRLVDAEQKELERQRDEASRQREALHMLLRLFPPYILTPPIKYDMNVADSLVDEEKDGDSAVEQGNEKQRSIKYIPQLGGVSNDFDDVPTLFTYPLPAWLLPLFTELDALSFVLRILLWILNSLVSVFTCCYCCCRRGRRRCHQRLIRLCGCCGCCCEYSGAYDRRNPSNKIAKSKSKSKKSRSGKNSKDLSTKETRKNQGMKERNGRSDDSADDYDSYSDIDDASYSDEEFSFDPNFRNELEAYEPEHLTGEELERESSGCCSLRKVQEEEIADLRDAISDAQSRVETHARALVRLVTREEVLRGLVLRFAGSKRFHAYKLGYDANGELHADLDHQNPYTAHMIGKNRNRPNSDLEDDSRSVVTVGTVATAKTLVQSLDELTAEAVAMDVEAEQLALEEEWKQLFLRTMKVISPLPELQTQNQSMGVITGASKDPNEAAAASTSLKSDNRLKNKVVVPSFVINDSAGVLGTNSVKNDSRRARSSDHRAVAKSQRLRAYEDSVKDPKCAFVTFESAETAEAILTLYKSAPRGRSAVLPLPFIVDPNEEVSLTVSTEKSPNNNNNTSSKTLKRSSSSSQKKLKRASSQSSVRSSRSTKSTRSVRSSRSNKSSRSRRSRYEGDDSTEAESDNYSDSDNISVFTRKSRSGRGQDAGRPKSLAKRPIIVDTNISKDQDGGACRVSLLYRGKAITVERAPPADEIMWTNLHTSLTERVLRQLVALIASLLLLAASFALFFAAQSLDLSALQDPSLLDRLRSTHLDPASSKLWAMPPDPSVRRLHDGPISSSYRSTINEFWSAPERTPYDAERLLPSAEALMCSSASSSLVSAFENSPFIFSPSSTPMNVSLAARFIRNATLARAGSGPATAAAGYPVYFAEQTLVPADIHGAEALGVLRPVQASFLKEFGWGWGVGMSAAARAGRLGAAPGGGVQFVLPGFVSLNRTVQLLSLVAAVASTEPSLRSPSDLSSGQLPLDLDYLASFDIFDGVSTLEIPEFVQSTCRNVSSLLSDALGAPFNQSHLVPLPVVAEASCGVFHDPLRLLAALRALERAEALAMQLSVLLPPDFFEDLQEDDEILVPVPARLSEQLFTRYLAPDTSQIPPNHYNLSVKVLRLPGTHGLPLKLRLSGQVLSIPSVAEAITPTPSTRSVDVLLSVWAQLGTEDWLVGEICDSQNLRLGRSLSMTYDRSSLVSPPFSTGTEGPDDAIHSLLLQRAVYIPLSAGSLGCACEETLFSAPDVLLPSLAEFGSALLRELHSMMRLDPLRKLLEEQLQTDVSFLDFASLASASEVQTGGDFFVSLPYDSVPFADSVGRTVVSDVRPPFYGPLSMDPSNSASLSGLERSGARILRLQPLLPPPLLLTPFAHCSRWLARYTAFTILLVLGVVAVLLLNAMLGRALALVARLDRSHTATGGKTLRFLRAVTVRFVNTALVFLVTDAAIPSGTGPAAASFSTVSNGLGLPGPQNLSAQALHALETRFRSLEAFPASSNVVSWLENAFMLNVTASNIVSPTNFPDYAPESLFVALNFVQPPQQEARSDDFDAEWYTGKGASLVLTMLLVSLVPPMLSFLHAVSGRLALGFRACCCSCCRIRAGSRKSPGVLPLDTTDRLAEAVAFVCTSLLFSTGLPILSVFLPLGLLLRLAVDAAMTAGGCVAPAASVREGSTVPRLALLSIPVALLLKLLVGGWMLSAQFITDISGGATFGEWGRLPSLDTAESWFSPLKIDLVGSNRMLISSPLTMESDIISSASRITGLHDVLQQMRSLDEYTHAADTISNLFTQSFPRSLRNSVDLEEDLSVYDWTGPPRAIGLARAHISALISYRANASLPHPQLSALELSLLRENLVADVFEGFLSVFSFLNNLTVSEGFHGGSSTSSPSVFDTSSFTTAGMVALASSFSDALTSRFQIPYVAPYGVIAVLLLALLALLLLRLLFTSLRPLIGYLLFTPIRTVRAGVTSCLSPGGFIYRCWKAICFVFSGDICRSRTERRRREVQRMREALSKAQTSAAQNAGVLYFFSCFPGSLVDPTLPAEALLQALRGVESVGNVDISHFSREGNGKEKSKALSLKKRLAAVKSASVANELERVRAAAEQAWLVYRGLSRRHFLAKKMAEFNNETEKDDEIYDKGENPMDTTYVSMFESSGPPGDAENSKKKSRRKKRAANMSKRKEAWLTELEELRQQELRRLRELLPRLVEEYSLGSVAACNLFRSNVDLRIGNSPSVFTGLYQDPSESSKYLYDSSTGAVHYSGQDGDSSRTNGVGAVVTTFSLGRATDMVIQARISPSGPSAVFARGLRALAGFVAPRKWLPRALAARVRFRELPPVRETRLLASYINARIDPRALHDDASALQAVGRLDAAIGANRAAGKMVEGSAWVRALTCGFLGHSLRSSKISEEERYEKSQGHRHSLRRGSRSGIDESKEDSKEEYSDEISEECSQGYSSDSESGSYDTSSLSAGSKYSEDSQRSSSSYDSYRDENRRRKSKYDYDLESVTDSNSEADSDKKKVPSYEFELDMDSDLESLENYARSTPSKSNKGDSSSRDHKSPSNSKHSRSTKKAQNIDEYDHSKDALFFQDDDGPSSTTTSSQKKRTLRRHEEIISDEAETEEVLPTTKYSRLNLFCARCVRRARPRLYDEKRVGNQVFTLSPLPPYYVAVALRALRGMVSYAPLASPQVMEDVILDKTAEEVRRNARNFEKSIFSNTRTKRVSEPDFSSVLRSYSSVAQAFFFEHSAADEVPRAAIFGSWEDNTDLISDLPVLAYRRDRAARAAALLQKREEERLKREAKKKNPDLSSEESSEREESSGSDYERKGRKSRSNSKSKSNSDKSSHRNKKRSSGKRREWEENEYSSEDNYNRFGGRDYESEYSRNRFREEEELEDTRYNQWDSSKSAKKSSSKGKSHRR